MAIGIYGDYTPANSARVYKVPLGISPSHGPENFTTFTDYLEGMTQTALPNPVTAATYTFVRADAGRMTVFDRATAIAATVPLNSTTAFPSNDATGYAVIDCFNKNVGVVTLTPFSGSVTLNGPLTLAQGESARLMQTATNVWWVLKGGAPKAAVSGSTGSPTVDTSSRPGKTIYIFNASGSLTISGTGGTSEVLIVGGGGGGGQGGNGGSYGGGGGGGGGEVIYLATCYLAGGVQTVTIGAGGLGTSSWRAGKSSSIGNYIASGGGGGATYATGRTDGGMGSSGGGAAGGPTPWTGGAAMSLVGYAGGNTSNYGGGGGGGCGAVGGNSSTHAGATGGAGIANSITGSSVTYGGGGGGGGGTPSWGVGAGGAGGGGAGGGYTAAGTAGTANTGGGGGGGGTTEGSGVYNGGAGGSGKVVVVIG